MRVCAASSLGTVSFNGPDALPRRILWLRLSNKPLADEVVFFAINVEIDAIAKEVIVINSEAVRRDQRSRFRFFPRLRIIEGGGEDTLCCVNARGDQADPQASILLKDKILEVVVVPNHRDHSNNKIGCSTRIMNLHSRNFVE